MPHSHWTDRPQTKKLLWMVYIVVLCVLLAAEFVVEDHYDGFMGIPGAYAWFGLVIGGVSIAAAKTWKAALKRNDTYYD